MSVTPSSSTPSSFHVETDKLMPPKNVSITEGLSKEVSFLLDQFLNLTAIPRPSHHEELATQFICNLATAKGWDFTRDEVGNVIVRIPGRGAGVGALPIALQSHLDMVCVPKERDFFNSPIVVTRGTREVKGKSRDCLMAEGTTLGADNGIGVATALTVALMDDLDHPPLELVFTTNEEDGMTGVRGLKAGTISSTWLINIDSEDFGVITQSAAGARDARIIVPLRRGSITYDTIPIVVELDDLPGGHSGVQVHEGRGNANIILAKCLARLSWQDLRIGLVSFEGGDKRNALPARATATLWCSSREVETLRTNLEESLRLELHKLRSKSIGASLSVEEISLKNVLPPLNSNDGLLLINALGALPDGVITWSKDVPDLVETSSTVSLVEYAKDALTITMMTRSSKDGAAREFQDRALGSFTAIVDSRITIENEYSGWPVDPENPLLEMATNVYRELFKDEARVEAIHAGLECGLLREKFPGLKMISIGPDVVDPHSPQEVLCLDTLEGFWTYFKGLLRNLCDRKAA